MFAVFGDGAWWVVRERIFGGVDGNLERKFTQKVIRKDSLMFMFVVYFKAEVLALNRSLSSAFGSLYSSSFLENDYLRG